MKKHLHNSLRALFLSLAVFLSSPMLALEVMIDGIKYDLNAETKHAAVIRKHIIDYYSGDVVIPESVVYQGTTYSVTSIGASAFWNSDGMTSVTIPNSITSIGDGAFHGCKGLTSVTIPNSVTSIGKNAFHSCSGLTSVTLPNSVTSIEYMTFKFCSKLTSVTIPNSVTYIGDDAFGGCSGLKSVTIPNNVRSIGNGAFENCTGLTSVTIPNGVRSILDRTFGGCSGLTSVTIPNSVTSIRVYAFYNCTGLTSVTIPNSVTSIGNLAFKGCYGLTSVTIPNSVTSIGKEAFRGCSGLTSVTIGNSVESIGNSAFWGCNLTSIHISDIAAWCNIDFDFGANPLAYADHLYLNGEEVKDLVIPNSVTSIGDWAFSGCKGLSSVTMPNSVTSIGEYAFYNCSDLSSVIIPNSVESIGEYAFHNCSDLSSVIIPNSVESIGGSAFSYCSGLTSVTIPNSVTSIGSWAFAYCPELLDVYCYAENVPSTESYAFDGSYPENATLHIPNASIDSYKATAPWSGFGKIVGLSGEEPEQPEVPEVEKCATPVVTYAEGKLSFSCETEGAEFITNVVAEDAKKYYDAEIEFSATYNIEVFATKANCENSDTVSVALVWVENGEVNEETGVISVPAAPVLVQGNGGILTVSGVVQNTEVVVYTIDGMEVDRAVASDGTATIYTGLQSGTIVVVKFGNKSVKVRI